MVKLTQKRQSVTRLITPVALALALAACSAPTSTPTARDVISQPATENSTFYLLQAETSQGEKQNDWYLLAIKALLNEQQLNQADVLLQRLSERQLNTEQRIEWTLARARFLAQTGQLADASQVLVLSPNWQLKDSQYVRFYQQKAKIARQQDNALGAVTHQYRLASYVDKNQAQQAWNTLWQDLQLLSQNEIKQLQNSDDDILAGWVELLDIARRYTGDVAEMQSQLDAYLASHPAHPANQYLPDNLADIQALTITQPTHVGVMLPLTDKFSEQGDAIRDGFVEAMLDANAEQRPKIRFYDTNALDIDTLTQRITHDGVDFVVGPLQKHKVVAVSNAIAGQVPVLALNEPTDDRYQQGVCYFTLSPEQEAAQAADRLHQQGYQFPLVLYPDSAFGQRMRDAFSTRWQSLTDTEVEQAPLGDRDKMQARIRDIFGLDASQRRIAQMKQLTDLPLQSQARSRRDIDAVYMVAGAAELTLLKPFIEVAINPDVQPPKLYASSRSNNRADGMGQLAELQGIEFSDIPLLISTQSAAYQQYQQRHPSPSNNTTRLHALGMDAYGLLKGLPQMQAQPGYQFSGQTGQLSLADNCVIHRQLDWARFGKTDIEPITNQTKQDAQ
ncbi:penicillin-binding protein activator [Salinivibrio kushneri]|uniref:Penicillin-binding protein activator n=1 Tax=Salinivibrio kushneri TaxID=1908198 RepID=A0AA47KL61_9GAMM|nr:penicillin-binding protein activator [Salinivibrio kushneri]WBA09006.1 penicillin-binding protein activator [Salinivibrio kushneri]